MKPLLAGAALVLVAAGVLVAVVNPFAGNASARGGVVDNAAPTQLATVTRRALTAQTPVSGTLGYAGSWTVAVPAGTPATDLQQAGQQETAARASYVTARATASADAQALATAGAALQAERLKETSDCAGGNAANAGPGSPCVSSLQVVTADQTAVATVRQKVVTDNAQLAGARSMLASARQALAASESSAPAYGGPASYTMLPGSGDVIRRGQPIYAIDGSPTLLLYGPTPAWRSFVAGMSPGRDVSELNANLQALGYGASGGDTYTSATAQAIRALQHDRALPASGSLPLGSVAFEPAEVRVTSVTSRLGQAVQPGPIITVSSTRHDVSIQLDASQQSQVRPGDRVLVTLPDNSSTPGVLSSVGRVATTPPSNQSSSGGGGPSTPTIEVDVRLLHPRAAGTLDRAPVDVLITTAEVRNALVVPVTALVALAGGGYAVEEVTASDTHQLLPVSPGLFDDQEGLVQVSGSGLAAGERVVVPAS